MTKILILGAAILAVAPSDTGANWETPGQILPKSAIPGAQLVDAELPADFQPMLYEWDGVGVVPSPKESLPIAVPSRHITKLAFRNRFTAAEKVAIDLASIDNPSADMAARQQSAAVRVSLADAAAASFIDLQREDTRLGVLMLEDAGILASGRALEILDAEVLESERAQ